MATYTGTPGNDTYRGGSGKDIIDGAAGNDTLYGNAGADIITGGTGNDFIDGGKGGDSVDGGAGSDTVLGGADADALIYRLGENAGASDLYSGNGGIDKLSLRFTTAEWLSATVQAEVARYVRYLATAVRNSKGEVAGDFTFNFGTAALKASTIESLEVWVNGVLIDYAAPTIALADDSGAASEDAASPTLVDTGTIDFYDINWSDTHTAAVLAVQGYTNPIGGTMTAAITDAATNDGTGRVTWTYQVANAATQYLAAGQSAIEKFNVRITDSTGKQVTQTVTVTVTGSNDGVTITSAAQGGTVVEDAASTPSPTDSLSASGTVAFTDVDLSDAHTASFAAAPGNTTALGTFALGAVSEAANAASGSLAWSYTLNNAAAQYLAAGQSVVESYVVTIDDGHGATATQNVVLTIAGTNDAVAITSAAQGGAVVEDAPDTPSPSDASSASGTVAFNDVDLSDTHAASYSAAPGNTTALGTFALGAVSEAANAANGTVAWTYTLDNSAAQYLAAGQSIGETYVVAIGDGHGSTATQNAVITIAGTNDAVAITSAAQGGAVVEDAPSTPTPSDSLSTSGTVTFNDVDLSDAHAASFTAAGNTTALGVFALAAVNEAANAAAGSVAWTYALNNGAAQYLAAGQSVVETFAVSIDDGHGSTATQNVAVTITGTNDAPTAYASQIATNENLAIVGKLSASDSDALDTLVFSVVAGPAHGVLALDADGGYRYTPAAGYAGADGFSFMVADGQGGTATANATIAIAGGTGAAQVTYVDLGTLQVDEEVSPPIARNWQPPEVAALADGGHVVVWSAYANAGMDAGGYGVYLQRYDAAGVKIGAPRRVNTATNDDQAYASVAAAGTGWVVVWSSLSQDASGWGVYGQRYAADGTPAGGEVRINASPQGDQVEANVAALAAGGYVVSWSGYNGAAGMDVYARIYDAAGTAGNTLPVNSVTTGSQSTEGAVTENIAGLAGGRFAVVWSGDGGSGTGVYGRVFEADGTAVTGQFAIATATGSEQYASVGAVGGGFVAAWTSYGEDGSGAGVCARRYDADGNALGSRFQVNTWFLGDQSYAKVQALADGGFAVVWQSAGVAGSGGDICGQRYDAAGNAMGGEFLVGGNLGDDQCPSLALREGALVVVWLDGSFASVEQKIVADFSTDTTPLVAVQVDAQVGPPTVDSWYAPEVTAVAGGGHVVVWSGYYDAADNSGAGVFQQRYDAAGTKVGTPQRVNTTTNNDQLHAGIAAAGSGWVVVWSSYAQDGSGWGVYAQRYDGAGNALGGEVQVNQATLNDQAEANVTELAGGGYVVSWTGFNAGNLSMDVYGRIYDAGGTAGDAFVLNSITAGSQVTEGAVTENVAGLSGGRFAAVWSGDGASGTGIHGRVFEADGTPVAGQFAIATATGTEQYASLGAVGSGFVAAWTSYGEDGSGAGVYARRYDADGNALGSRFQVNTWFLGDQSYAKVQALADGGFVVVWQDGVAGSGGADIAGQRYDAAGNVVGGEFRIGGQLGDDQFPSLALRGSALVAVWLDGSIGTVEQKIVADFATDTTPLAVAQADEQVGAPIIDNAQPKIAALGDGGHVVVWFGHYSSYDGSGSGVFQQRYDAAGEKVGAAQRVNTTTDGDQAYASVAAAGSGWVVSWSSYRASDQSWNVYAQRYGANGAPLGGEASVNQGPLPWWDSGQPNVGALANGGYVISWDGYNSGSGSVDVYARIYGADGAAGAPFIVNSITAGDQYTEGAWSNTESVVGLASGRFVVVWYGDDGADHVYARVFQASGAAVGAQFEVGGTLSNYAASVGALGSGFVVTWTSWGQDVADVYARRYDGDGNALGAAFRVNSWSMGEQTASKALALADGGFVVVWQSYGVDGHDGSHGICGQRYDAAGNAVGGEFMVNAISASGTEDDRFPSLALREGDGALVVVWQDGTFGSIERKIITSFDGPGIGAKNLLGGDGSDSFVGSDLADTLAGGGGDDRLDGLLGNDQLSGGGGADVFVFSTALGAGNVDTLADFVSGSDRILLDNAAGGPFAGLPDGALAATALDVVGDATAPTTDTRIVYDPSSGALYYDADGSGGVSAVQIALLGNLPVTLAAVDFIAGG